MISVIVPVYNVERYISRCLDSILAQTFKDFEILIIDDGSEDSSYQICKSYSQLDNRISVFRKSNGGLSDARNYGLKKIKGEYFTFIDSDDYIGPQYLEILYEMSSTNEAEISQIQFTNVYTDELELKNSNDDRFVAEGKEAFLMMINNNRFNWSSIGKLYKKSLINAINFPVGYVYEDMYTIPYVFPICSKCAVSDSIQYYYFQRKGSITHALSIKKLEMWEGAIDKLREYTAKHYFESLKYLDEYLVNALIDYFVDSTLYSELYNKIIFEIKRKYSNQFEIIARAKNIKYKRRISAFLVSKHPKIYRNIKKAWLKIKPDIIGKMYRDKISYVE